MIRVSNPSIGPDCHGSSPFPCGTPSTTSTMTTVRAKFFSASRWAAVAPTFPAPTTATLASIQMLDHSGLSELCRPKPPEYTGLRRALGVRSQESGIWWRVLTPVLRVLTCLTQCLVQNNADCIRQIETPHCAAHRNREALLRMLLQNPQ